MSRVCSRDASRARSFRRPHRRPRDLGRVDELLAAPDVDAVYLASPTRRTPRRSRRAVDAGIPVLVEKPAVADGGGVGCRCRARPQSGASCSWEAMRTAYDPGLAAVQAVGGGLGRVRRSPSDTRRGRHGTTSPRRSADEHPRPGNGRWRAPRPRGLSVVTRSCGSSGSRGRCTALAWGSPRPPMGSVVLWPSTTGSWPTWRGRNHRHEPAERDPGGDASLLVDAIDAPRRLVLTPARRRSSGDHRAGRRQSDDR